MRAESREERALRELNEVTADTFRRSPRRGGNVRVVVEDRPEGREVDVDDGRGGQVRIDPPGR